MKVLAPRYLETIVYAALVQSAASELGARMTAMSSATDNAGKLVKNLELSYNKARQALITRELSEILRRRRSIETTIRIIRRELKP